MLGSTVPCFRLVSRPTSMFKIKNKYCFRKQKYRHDLVFLDIIVFIFVTYLCIEYKFLYEF